jgi:hypothetical protein
MFEQAIEARRPNGNKNPQEESLMGIEQHN